MINDSEPLRRDLEALQGQLATRTGLGTTSLLALILAAGFALICAAGLARVQLLDSRRRQVLAEAQRLEAERQEQEAKRVNDANQAAILRLMNELQTVADSTDGSKRQRGRRGLDILQRMQSNAAIQVQIVPDDFPSIREVDLKLLELAKKWEAKVLTNDFNLNKVAHIHHVDVLNINDLANALKPVVLPGERMMVLILKEGKEFNQGVGYLDDGTMVVVDHARKLIGKTVEISVTSVLQTASGKMIFGKLDESGKAAEVQYAGK